MQLNAGDKIGIVLTIISLILSIFLEDWMGVCGWAQALLFMYLFFKERNKNI